MSFYKAVDSEYRIIDSISDNVFIVRSNTDGRIYVRKDLEIYCREIYQYLKNNPVKHIPEVSNVYVTDKGITVIEEYVNGITLDDYVHENGPLSESESLRIMTSLCQTVGDLHDCDPAIIHRDIKPENIIIRNDGTVVLLDIDAAKFYSETQSKDTYLLGTHGYAAPEQYGFGKANKTSDIYGLGKVLNFMLTGDINKLATGNVKDIIDKCTEIDYVNRYQSTAELLKDIKRLKSDPGKTIRKTVGYVCFVLFTLAFAFAEFEGITGVVNTWICRILYYLTFMSTIMFAVDFKGIWKRVGIDRINNKPLKVTAIILITMGILLLGIIITSTVISGLE